MKNRMSCLKFFSKIECNNENDEVDQWCSELTLRAVVVTITSRRTNRNDSFKEDNVTSGLAEDVDGDAGVVGVLLLLNGDDSQNCVGVFVVEGKVRDTVVLRQMNDSLKLVNTSIFHFSHIIVAYSIASQHNV